MTAAILPVICARRWNFITVDAIDRAGLIYTSYAALAVAGLGFWVFFPGAWTVVAWLLAALALAWFADRLSSRDLATQSDILALIRQKIHLQELLV